MVESCGFTTYSSNPVHHRFLAQTRLQLVPRLAIPGPGLCEVAPTDGSACGAHTRAAPAAEAQCALHTAHRNPCQHTCWTHL